MPIFTVRVVLQGHPTLRDFLGLRSKLASCGVIDVIVGDDGRKYRLPPAEYVYVGSESVTQVRDAVMRVARSVMPTAQVLVTEGSRRAWAGLEEVQAAHRDVRRHGLIKTP